MAPMLVVPHTSMATIIIHNLSESHSRTTEAARTVSHMNPFVNSAALGFLISHLKHGFGTALSAIVASEPGKQEGNLLPVFDVGLAHSQLQFVLLKEL